MSLVIMSLAVSGMIPNRPSQDRDLASPTAGPQAELMTLLFTDMVGSTRLKEELGNEEGVRLIQEHHALIRKLIAEFPNAVEIDNAGDAFFIVFRRASDAVRFALALQARSQAWNRGHRHKILDRVGIHVGEVIVENDPETGRPRAVRGLEVDKCARVMSLAEGHHILLTRFAFDNARAMLRGHRLEGGGVLRWISHGFYELKGIVEPVEICEVGEAGLAPLLAPSDSEKARRLDTETESQVVAAESGPILIWLERLTVGTRFHRKLALWGAGLSALMGVFALVLPFTLPLTYASYDLSYFFRPTQIPAGAVIVRMDRPSHDALRQPLMQPWDRRIHAQLMDRMREWNARAVVFDVLFDRPADDPAQDAALVAAAKRFGKAAVAGVVSAELSEGTIVGYRVEGPFPDLREAATWGLVSKADSDLIIRQPMPSVPEKPALEVAVGDLIQAPGRVVPTGAHWLNYYGPPGTIESFAYSEVLEGHIAPKRFANKIVFVGAVYDLGYSGGRGTDDFKTPYSRWTGRRSPGVEVIATATLNLVRGEWLRRLGPWTELSLVVVFGLCSGFVWTALRPLTGAIAGTVLASGLALLAMTNVRQTKVWFPWLVPCAVQLPFSFAWSVVVLASRAATPHQHRFRRGAQGKQIMVEQTVPEAGVLESANISRRDGALVIPNYTLLRQIGRGAYGEVWLVQDPIGLFRAIKVIHRRTFSDPVPYEREFEGMRRFTPLSLQHSGLVQVLHVGREDERGYFYYVMELADDHAAGSQIEVGSYSPRTLESDLRMRGFLPTREVLALGGALGGALQFLHEHRLVHRDLKPANILFVRGAPKVADIGLVTVMADEARTVSFLGTKGYMAPEGPGLATADVYSLGKVLYVAAMGRSPAEFPELPTDLDSRPERPMLLQLNKILLRACDPHPEARFASAAECVRALEQLAEGAQG